MTEVHLLKVNNIFSLHEHLLLTPQYKLQNVDDSFVS